MHTDLPAQPSARTPHHRGPRGLGVALLLPFVVATACDEPTGIGPVAATYVARTVNGVVIPAPLRQNANYELLVLADTLRFDMSGRAEWTWVRRTTVTGFAPHVEDARVDYSYQVRGDSLRFSFRCPPDADCAPPPAGLFSADRRHLVVQLRLPDGVLEYERTDQ